MKNLILLLQLFILSNAFAQNKQSNNCDIKHLISLEAKVEKLNYNDIHFFNNSFDVKCKDNIEFQEVYNEILFKIIKQYPNEVLKIISKTGKERKSLIFNELSNSILDTDINSIIKSLDNVKGYENLKKSIIEELQKNEL